MSQRERVKMGYDYKKVSLDNLKRRLNGWLDWNMSISEEKEFHIKEIYTQVSKKLFIKVIEKGGRDYMNDGSNYYMILQSQGDESEMNEEIETE